MCATATLAVVIGPARPSAGAPVRVRPPTITSPADGSTVTTATPRLAGTGAPGDSIIATEAGFIRCVATVSADGRWACTSNSSFNNGIHHVTATQTNRAGVMSGNSDTLNLNVRARGVLSSPTHASTPTPRATPVRSRAGTPAPRAVTASEKSSSDRNVPLAIAAVLALAVVVVGAAYLRLRPRRQA